MQKKNSNTVVSAREAAYLAILASQHHDTYASDYLEQWRTTSAPSSQDQKLAQEIAYGTIRMALALDYMAEKLAERKKLSLKPKERALLRSALYQQAFMSRIPVYAIVNESVAIAKKYCHATFAAFLNAILRKLSETTLALPAGDQVDALSVRLSYPLYFVQQLLKDYTYDQVLAILENGNQAGKTQYRIRPVATSQESSKTGLLLEDPPIKVLAAGTDIAEIAASPNYYIQNVTPAHLIAVLSADYGKKTPERVLDLCAAPGGKLLAMHDRFPQSLLYANDVSKNKLELLQINIRKYGLKVQLSCVKGEEFQSKDPFDIIILDVPCSNTGVLNKRPEARWRLSEDYLMQQEKLQKSLLEKAVELVKPDGEIWYMTCSVLKRENEEMVRWAEQHLGMHIKKEVVVLPNAEGWDGGYACSLVHRSFSM